MRRALRAEEGLAIPVAMAILVIVMGVAAAAVSLGLNNLDEARKDRAYTRALAAADSGVDVAASRLNRLIIAADGADILGTVPLEMVPINGCAITDAAGDLGVSALSGAGWCQASAWEELETKTDPTRKQEFTYSVSSGVTTGGGLIQRRVVATGRVGSTKRRVMSILVFNPSEDNETSLFRRQRFVECPVEPSNPLVPDSGCPA